MDIYEQLRAWAEKSGFRISSFHDGLCDFQNLRTGMTYRDDPLDDALAYFKWNARYAVEFNAKLCHVDTERFDVYGVIPCRDKHRTRRNVCLLHTKAPCAVPWALKTPDGTRSFHDFHSMATFAAGVSGRDRNLTSTQYAIVMRAYHEHVESGKAFAMPEI